MSSVMIYYRVIALSLGMTPQQLANRISRHRDYPIHHRRQRHTTPSHGNEEEELVNVYRTPPHIWQIGF